MDFGEIAIRGLERDRVRLLSRRSNSRGLVQLACHCALLIGSGALLWACRGSWWIMPATVVHGVILSFLFCPLHESVHRTAFASRSINDSVSWICGALLILPPEYFRLFHFAHHRHTQDPSRDPELTAPAPSSIASYAWRISGLPYWYDRLAVTLRHALTGRVSEGFVVSDDMFSNSRTTYTNSVVRLLTWRMSYHAEHHAYPSVPFHRLKYVNVFVRQQIVFATPGYWRVHRDLLRRFSRRQSVA